MEVWTQRVPCKVNVTLEYFARDPLRLYFHEPQKNEIYFLNVAELLDRGKPKAEDWRQ